MTEDTDVLKLRPLKLAEMEPRDGGVVLLLPKWKRPLTRRMARALRLAENFRINLDDYGAFVLTLCTGEFTVEEIGIRLKKRFGRDVEPLYPRLVDFLYTLEGSGVIEFRGLEKSRT